MTEADGVGVHAGTEQLMAAGVRLDVAGELATVSLNRPERRNAQTPVLWGALREAGRRLPDGVRVVIVCGEGPSFSAGLDLRMLEPGGVPGEGSFADLSGLDDAALEDFVSRAQEGFRWLGDRQDLVSVAAVQGHAVGAGFQLALACDLRVLADDARLAMKEPAMGLVPDLGGTKALVDTVGYARALEICLTGRRVGAEEAREIGLAELVVPAADLEETVRELAAALLATPSGAAAATKQLLAGAASRSRSEQLAAERQAQVHRLRAILRE